MKKTYLISLIAVFILILSSYSIFAQSSDKILLTENIKVSFVNQEPDPAEPGTFVDVRFKFENIGLETSDEITVELLPEFPFSLLPGKSAVTKLGTLHARQLGEDGVIVKYKLIVDKDAVEGINDLKLRYRIGNNVWIEPDEYEIQIQTHDAILSIDSIKISPERVKPGDKASLSVSISNLADSLLKDIRIKLNLDNSPLAAFGSSNRKTIKDISSGKEIEVKFDIISEPDAESDLYTIPIGIEYSDKLGKAYNITGSFGIVVGSDPELYPIIDSTEIYNSEKTGDITVKFVNMGLTDIKFLNVNLKSSDKYKIISADEVYIGNIDSDDYETAEFKLFVKKTKEENIILPITYEYRDANNIEYKKQISLKLPLYSTAEAKKLGIVEGNGKVGIFLVIIIVVVGLYIYRRWKKGKKLISFGFRKKSR